MATYYRPKVAKFQSSAIDYSKVNNDASKRHRMYASSHWQAKRTAKLMDNPIDELLLLDDDMNAQPAQQVHHIVKFFEQPSPSIQFMLMTDDDNLVSLTTETHNNIHYHPEFLSNRQSEWLQQKKKEIQDKYFEQGIVINMPDDVSDTTKKFQKKSKNR